MDDRFFALVQSLSNSRNLPVELVTMIVRHFRKTHLLSIGRLSRHLNRVVSAIIYHDVKFDFDHDLSHESGGPRLIRLLRTLLINPSAARYISRVSIVGAPLFKWRQRLWDGQNCEDSFPEHPLPECSYKLRSWFSLPELRLYLRALLSVIDPIPARQSDEFGQLHNLILVLFASVPELKHLRIDTDFLRYSALRSGISRHSKKGAFKSLTAVTLGGDLPESGLIVRPEDPYKTIMATRHWDDVLVLPFSAPSVESVSIAAPLLASSMPRMWLNTLKSLRIKHLQKGEFDLAQVFHGCSSLQHLEYQAWVSSPWWMSQAMFRPGTYGLKPLFDVLDCLAETLEHLELCECFWMDSCTFPWTASPIEQILPLADENAISRLRRLTSLTIPWNHLLGSRAYRFGETAWQNILPPALRNLTLTDHLSEVVGVGSWTDQSLMPFFSDLAKYLEECGRGTGKPSLSLSLIHTSWDWPEPMREELRTLCAQHGLQASIVKLRDDRPNHFFRKCDGLQASLPLRSEAIQPRRHATRPRGRGGRLSFGRGRGY